jgi:hypothetical protein
MAKKYTRKYAKRVAKKNTTAYFKDMILAGMPFTKRDVKKYEKKTFLSQMKWNKIMKGKSTYEKEFSKKR